MCILTHFLLTSRTLIIAISSANWALVVGGRGEHGTVSVRDTIAYLAFWVPHSTNEFLSVKKHRSRFSSGVCLSQALPCHVSVKNYFLTITFYLPLVPQGRMELD